VFTVPGNIGGRSEMP